MNSPTIPATTQRFYQALGLSHSNAADRRRFAFIKRALRRLAVEHMDVAHTYRNQDFDCVEEFWQQAASAYMAPEVCATAAGYLESRNYVMRYWASYRWQFRD